MLLRRRRPTEDVTAADGTSPVRQLCLAHRTRTIELLRNGRAEYSKGIIDAIYYEAARLQELRSTLPKSKLGKALGYLM